jgi:hypothetical protein
MFSDPLIVDFDAVEVGPWSMRTWSASGQSKWASVELFQAPQLGAEWSDPARSGIIGMLRVGGTTLLIQASLHHAILEVGH